MTKQYISDVINNSEIKKWKDGDRILITSQTGSGKSQWIKDYLYDYCLKNNKTILLLSNRVVLKNQNLAELGLDKSDIITLKNYQTLESSFLFGNTLEELFAKFDYICFDEIHYLLSDSSFNSNTDILMQPIRHPNNNKVFIFLTATPEAIYKYNLIYEYKYTVETDYSYIENLFFYNKDETVENILRTVPYNEKVLYFGNALDAFDLYTKFSDSEFICSDNNKEFNKKSSKSTIKEIANENKFTCRFLFSTKVLDNGINIILPELKHIIIDMTDPIDIIQCLGRKRILNDEKINVYIKNNNGRNIYPHLSRARDRLKLVQERKEIGKEEFQNKYARKKLDDIILNNAEINQAKLYYSRYVIDTFSKILNDNSKMGYQKYICKILNYNIKDTKIAEEYYEQKSLELILESFLNKKLYKGEEQEMFKSVFFENIFAPKRKINIRNRGINCINSILQEDNLPYEVISRVDKTKEKRDKTYWWVTKIE
jgi:hypothetical protein